MKIVEIFQPVFILFLVSVASCQPGVALSASPPNLSAAIGPQARTNFCRPLASPTGPTVTVSTEAELRRQAYNAASGTTILVSSGKK